MTADRDMTDEEWREERFTTEELHSARTLGKPPTFEQLKKHMERFGPDGILETAILLPRSQFEKLEVMVNKLPKVRQRRPYRRTP